MLKISVRRRIKGWRKFSPWYKLSSYDNGSVIRIGFLIIEVWKID